jgi:hypothetical protein
MPTTNLPGNDRSQVSSSSPPREREAGLDRSHYKAAQRARLVDGFARRTPLGALRIPDKLPLGGQHG